MELVKMMENSGVRFPANHQLRAGMVGVGMIFDETYRPFLEAVHRQPFFHSAYGSCQVALAGIASRTGKRAEAYQQVAREKVTPFAVLKEPNAIDQLLDVGVDFVCIATPDNRHFSAARAALAAGKHVLVEKPSVLSLQELDQLVELAQREKVLAKIVYHKLLDPDHKKLQTFVADGELCHVNNGYCNLLEPKAISGGQFSEWIEGRNPGTYVAVHYIKLIDFTFGGRLKTVSCTGQRGLVGAHDGPTWDSTQLRLIYEYESGREAAFDIHTSWVTPDNFPGWVEQEVQFRFDNGVWNGHSRRRGVECTIEGKTPLDIKITINNHYSGSFLEPWGERSHRGYGVEAIGRFAHEVAMVEYGGNEGEREARLDEIRQLDYNELAADRQVVAAIQAIEAILARRVEGVEDCIVRVNDEQGGLVLHTPGSAKAEVLYGPTV